MQTVIVFFIQKPAITKKPRSVFTGAANMRLMLNCRWWSEGEKTGHLNMWWKKKDQLIKIVYTPNVGININGVEIKWSIKRSTVQRLLGNAHKTDDKVIDLSQYFSGDESRNIYQRRDIYKQFKDFDNYFFLKYNRKDELEELEVHHGCTIEIMGIQLFFNDDIKNALASLQSLSNTCKQLNPGDYYFRDLKLTIADSTHIGGDGHNLAYFYCSVDTSHLDE